MMNHFYHPRFWLGTTLIVALIITSISVVETAYTTRKLYSALQEILAERSRLTAEWSRLLLERGAVSSDLRIDRLAKSSLFMRAPDLSHIRLMERDR